MDFFRFMVFFYRRFRPLDVYVYAFGTKNDASSSNLPIPFITFVEVSQILAFETSLFLFFSYSTKRFNHAPSNQCYVRTEVPSTHQSKTMTPPYLTKAMLAL